MYKNKWILISCLNYIYTYKFITDSNIYLLNVLWFQVDMINFIRKNLLFSDDKQKRQSLPVAYILNRHEELREYIRSSQLEQKICRVYLDLESVSIVGRQFCCMLLSLHWYFFHTL